MSTSSISITSLRSLHLVDLENLVGRCDLDDPIAVRAQFARDLQLARWVGGDHVVVAANAAIVKAIGFEPQVPCNLHAVRGRDAADVMLLALAPPELVARRYARLVIGSGDGIFAARAQQARTLGVAVEVVARHRACSRRLLKTFPCSFMPSAPAHFVLAA